MTSAALAAQTVHTNQVLGFSLFAREGMAFV
jgi:hypothetical protein